MDAIDLAGRRIPIVSVHDGEEGLLDNIGSIVGARQLSLAVRRFSKCGTPDQIYEYQGGAKAEINLAGLMLRRLQVIGSTLRALSEEQKAGIVTGFLRTFGESLHSGAVRPIVDTIFPLAEAAQAHRLMQASTHFGKIILEVG